MDQVNGDPGFHASKSFVKPWSKYRSQFVHLQLILLQFLNIMHPHDVLHPTPVRVLKRTVTDLEFGSEPASKRTRLSPDQLPTPPYTTQQGHPKRSSRPSDSSGWRERLKSSLLRRLDDHYPSTNKQLTASPQLRDWLDTIPCPRAGSCPANSHIFSSLPYPFRSDYIELKRSQSCEARFDLVRPTSALDPKPKRARLRLTALQNMSQQESQYDDSLVPRSNSSSTKAPGTSDAAYIDTLYGHGIVMDPSGRKIPEELRPLKEQILQKRSSPQLDDQAIFAVMDAAEELAYDLEGPTNKVLLRTPMFPLRYGGLIEGGNTQWNTVAMPNNPRCDNKLSAPKPDAYLAYPRGAKSPWTVEQNNVINHPRVRPYSQPTEYNTFPSLIVELEAEATGGVRTPAEARAAGSGSHSVNTMLWLLEEAKAAGLTQVDLMQDTVSFSIVSSHRQTVAYLHWLDPKEKHFYMSYLKSYSAFEADSIRGCNNTIKNIIDNAIGPRKIKIGEALVTLEPIRGSWNPQPTTTDPLKSNGSFSGDPRPYERDRDS